MSELDKLQKIQPKSQTIGEFLDWLNYTKKYAICAWVEITKGEWEIIPEGYYPVRTQVEDLLAEYFNIDLKKVEQEKQKMLDDLRKMNEKKAAGRSE